MNNTDIIKPSDAYRPTVITGETVPSMLWIYGLRTLGFAALLSSSYIVGRFGADPRGVTLLSSIFVLVCVGPLCACAGFLFQASLNAYEVRRAMLYGTYYPRRFEVTDDPN